MHHTSTVEIYDTTLRDGTQGEGFSLSLQDKLQIAKALDNFGISYIEGGWPGSNPKDVEFFELAAQLEWKHAQIAAFGSTRRPHVAVDEDPQIASLLAAKTPVVTFFGKSWDLHVTEVLKVSLEENLAMIYDTTSYLKKHGRKVFFDAEHFFDGFKANQEYAIQVLGEAVRAGADSLVLCDTNGGTLPSEIISIIKLVKEQYPQANIGIHTHNDCELGVANAIAAVEAGASQIQGTINGYGERTGNCNLTSVIPIIELKKDIKVVNDLSHLKSLSFLVDDLSNNPHFLRMPFVGKTAFAHKGGMHVNAVQKLARSYEHIQPELVGNEQAILVSELSGQANILMKAEDLGFPLQKGSQEALEVLKKVKEAENEGYSYEAAGGSLELIIRKVMGNYKEYFLLDKYQCQYTLLPKEKGAEPICEASIKLRIGAEVSHSVSEGHGVIHALDLALRKSLLPFFPSIEKVHLTDYKVRILNGNDATAAKTRVLIALGDGERMWGSVGVSDSIIEASLHALLDGIDVFLQRQQK